MRNLMTNETAQVKIAAALLIMVGVLYGLMTYAEHQREQERLAAGIDIQQMIRSK